RAMYRKEFGSLDKAEEDLARARDQLKAADEAEVLWASADVARARKQLDEARSYLEKGVQLYPRKTAFYTSLADLEAQGGKLREAMCWLRRGLKETPENADLRWALTELLIQLQKPDALKEAEANIEQLRATGSTNPLVDYLDGRLLLAKQEWYKASQ